MLWNESIEKWPKQLIYPIFTIILLYFWLSSDTQFITGVSLKVDALFILNIPANMRNQLLPNIFSN